MAITSTTPIASVQVDYSIESRWPVYITVVSDEDEPQEEYISLYDPVSDDQTGAYEGASLLADLVSRWGTDSGLKDRNDNFIEPTTTNVRFGSGTQYLYNLPQGWYHPFNEEFVAAPMLQGSVTSLGTRTFSVILWQETALTHPVSPPADWYQEATGIVTDIGDWHHNRLAAANANPGSDPMRFAIDRVTIDADGNETYNGWEIFTEFEVEYSADRTTWHDTQQDDDRYFGFLAPNGQRRVIEIASPPNLDWTQIYEGQLYRTISREHHMGDFGGTVNLDLYERLRITWTAFGRWDGDDPDNLGASVVAYLHKPEGGWKSGTTEDDNDIDGTFSWLFDEAEGGAMSFQGENSRGAITLPVAIIRDDSGGESQPAEKLSGKGKFIGSDSANPHMVQKIRLYDFAETGAGGTVHYQRATWKIEGATY